VVRAGSGRHGAALPQGADVVAHRSVLDELPILYAEQVHVGHVFQKLALRSRAELPGALAEG
jgi:hypothetical protein